MFREMSWKDQAHLSRLQSKLTASCGHFGNVGLWNPPSQVPTALIWLSCTRLAFFKLYFALFFGKDVYCAFLIFLHIL